MPKRDPRVDAYIAKAPDFAKPILTHVREVVHAACPQCEEDMKWSTPTFMYKGMLAGMSAFKAHCRIGFWKGPLIMDADGQPLGHNPFERVTTVADLPSKKVLTGYVKQAMQLNEAGTTVKRAPSAAAQKPVSVPADLEAALAKNKKAAASFGAFSPSHKREYIEWITEAKAEETRKRRLAQAVEWMAEGKSRNWKYMKA